MPELLVHDIQRVDLDHRQRLARHAQSDRMTQLIRQRLPRRFARNPLRECFRGVRGMFYGASGSVFNPPPGDHVLTHLYMACLDDPDGRFRERGGGV